MEKARPDVKPADLEVLGEAYRKEWSVNGGLNLDGGEIHHRDGLQAARLQGSAPGRAEEWIDTSFIDAALKDIGTDPSHGRDRPMNEAGIAIRNVSKTFRRAKEDVGVQALQQVSLDIEPNTFVSLVGPSGCGKTTLLRMLNGLIAPDSGEILVGGEPPCPGPHMGFVFQSFRLMPWRTIRDNVAFPCELDGRRRERTRRSRRPATRHGRACGASPIPIRTSSRAA